MNAARSHRSGQQVTEARIAPAARRGRRGPRRGPPGRILQARFQNPCCLYSTRSARCRCRRTSAGRTFRRRVVPDRLRAGARRGAAPTAGPHFDREMLQQTEAGVRHAWVTLHVGAGTRPCVANISKRIACTVNGSGAGPAAGSSSRPALQVWLPSALRPSARSKRRRRAVRSRRSAKRIFSSFPDTSSGRSINDHELSPATVIAADAGRGVAGRERILSAYNTLCVRSIASSATVSMFLTPGGSP